MNEKDLYKTTFSQLHTTTTLDMEYYKKMKRKTKRRYKITAAAACFGILLATSTTVYASNMFGLKDMLIGNSITSESPGNTTPINSSDPNNLNQNDASSSTANVTPPPESIIAEPTQTPTPPVTLISLQGYSNSNECKAVSEWTKFHENYDTDGTLLAKVGNGPTGLDSKYDLYLVYTQEMADKLDEILAKYKLSLHQSLTVLESTDELLQKADIGNFLGTANTNNGAYMYEDGTFHIDGGAILDNGLSIDYQFMSCKKGAFTDTILNIGDIGDYTEWTYKTACGINARLAISPGKALIIVELEDSFVTVNVLAGTEHGFLDDSGKITASDLEKLADSFDYTLLK